MQKLSKKTEHFLLGLFNIIAQATMLILSQHVEQRKTLKGGLRTRRIFPS